MVFVKPIFLSTCAPRLYTRLVAYLAGVWCAICVCMLRLVCDRGSVCTRAQDAERAADAMEEMAEALQARLVYWLVMHLPPHFCVIDVSRCSLVLCSQ